MLVVSDTSPLNYLVLIEAIGVLPVLFSDIYVPPAVMEELLHPAAPQPVRDWANAPPEWLRIRAPGGIVEVPGLGRSETEAIALAEELHADAILIDERDGSRIAHQRGIAVVGTLAVLANAVVQNLVNQGEITNRLSKTNFCGPMNLFARLVDEFRTTDIEGT